MKTNIFIKGIGSISKLSETDEIQVAIVEPVYKELIPAIKLRRMSRVMRMSNFAAKKALVQANRTTTDAINIATGLGCLTDTEKFLSTLLDHNEEFANPSAFINSTHNTLAGSLAILLGTKGQNFTFVDLENSFEYALLDASVSLAEGNYKDFLVGGVDEKIELLESVCSTENIGEGASFVVVSNEENDDALVAITGVEIDNSQKDTSVFIDSFLEEMSVDICSVDLILSNGYKFETPTLVYSDVSGAYPTASAFACTLAADIINNQVVPKFSFIQLEEIQNILVFSSYESGSKSAMLLTKIN